MCGLESERGKLKFDAPLNWQPVEFSKCDYTSNIIISNRHCSRLLVQTDHTAPPGEWCMCCVYIICARINKDSSLLVRFCTSLVRSHVLQLCYFGQLSRFQFYFCLYFLHQLHKNIGISYRSVCTRLVVFNKIRQNHTRFSRLITSWLFLGSVDIQNA